MAFTERARHAHVARERGPRFAWNDEQEMHVPVVSGAKEKEAGKRAQLERIAVECFRNDGGVGLTWEQLHVEIERIEGLSRSSARRRFEAITKKLLLRSAQNCGFSKHRAEDALSELLGAKELFKHYRKRSGTNAEVWISRHEQTLMEVSE